LCRLGAMSVNSQTVTANVASIRQSSV
jgi:hypothetical protein